MTEPMQKDLDELYEQLAQEETCCESCRYVGVSEMCECCATGGNIRSLEQLIHSLEE